ncbi:LamG-like jellyroll fold domain-containing protein [Promicromonospora sp. NPDC019610]|uniref:LamG-like jellyroll fold domain-containing protein n=1 Tax=Promicromonospora sp. NPDC019610 TaxID=3364405 RepID=UPI0037BD663B
MRGLTAAAVAVLCVVPASPSQATETPAPDVSTEDFTSGYAIGKAPDANDADPAEAEALTQAAETGELVEITANRAETREVYATPSGEIEVREFVVPKWARVDGHWVAVDTTLEASSEGIAPAASASSVVFSPGGNDRPLVSMARHGRVLEWSWPDALPEPVLDDDTATYRDVIDGVDLQMKATEDGFASYLVVKNAEAAASPALDEITFAMETRGLAVGVTAAGVLEAKDSSTGSVVFEAPPASMWSAAPAEGAVAGQKERVEARSADAVAGEEAASGGRDIAPVDVQVSPEGDSFTLVPDQDLLESPDTSFPVTIDPAVSTPRTSAWTSPNESYPSTSYWQFKGQTTAGLGTCTGWSDCPGGATYRLFYQFDVSKFKGKNVSSAVFAVPNTHSAVCVDHTVNVFQTKAISSATTWNTQAASGFFKKQVASASFNYGGNQSGCKNAGDAEFSVRALVQEGADAGWNQVTLGMRAASESDKNQWKKFSRSAYLRVTYNTVPSKVARSALSMKFGGACTDTSNSDPLRLRTVDGNILRVAEGAAKDPDPNEEVRVQFQLERADGTVIDTIDTGWAKPGSYFAASVPASKIPENQLVRWFVRVQDRKVDNSGPNSSGPWSDPGCFFVLDTNAPPAPRIISEEGEYPEPDPSDPDDMPHDGVGEYGWFEISSSAFDVAKIEYWFGNGERTTKSGSVVRVAYLPLDPGQHSLYARAYDAAGNKLSTPTEYAFRVNYGRNPVGNWTFDDPAEGHQAPSPYVLSGDATQIDPEAQTPTIDPAEGDALQLDGAGDYATGPDVGDKPAGWVNTRGHFSVEAWVRPDTLPSGSGMSFVASQPGQQQMGFRLYYAGADGEWSFSQHDDDVAGATGPRATNAATVTPGKWVHLLGVHDASRKKLVLYVNGVAGPEITLDSPWTAAGPVMIGASRYGSTYGNYFDGLIDSVRTYDRIVTPSEAAALATRLPAVKARWNFESADLEKDASGKAVKALGSENPAGVRIGPKLTLPTGATQGEELMGKVDDFALNLDASAAAYTDLSVVPVSMDESFTISGWAQAVGVPTSTGTVMSISGGNEEALMVRFEPGSGDDETTGGTWNLYVREANSTSGELHRVQSTEGATATSWNHFAVVYDAPRQTAHLYINAASSEDIGVGRTEPGAVPFTNVARFNLGRGLSNGAWDSYWAGGLDDVWVFKGALSQVQIRALENGTPGIPTVVPGAAQ